MCPPAWAPRDITQSAVSVPALVVEGWTKEWRGEGQAAEKVGQLFMELPPYSSPLQCYKALAQDFHLPAAAPPQSQFKGSVSSPVPDAYLALLSG